MIPLSISILISIFLKDFLSISISISIFSALPYRYRFRYQYFPELSYRYRYRYFQKWPCRYRYRYRYFSKVSIYRQSIFDIDISNRANIWWAGQLTEFLWLDGHDVIVLKRVGVGFRGVPLNVYYVHLYHHREIRLSRLIFQLVLFIRQALCFYWLLVILCLNWKWARRSV